MKPLQVDSKYVNPRLGKRGWLGVWRIMLKNHIRESEIWECDCDACTRAQKRIVNEGGQ